tara:strand:- start:2697 stop:3224 length:528 start_codon:yes stop_codon:yes gene_type:complete
VINKEIEQKIRTIPNFPKDGINFKDITPLLLDSRLSERIVDIFINKLKDLRVDAVVGIESRGFLYGFLLAHKLKVPFVPIRKAGKLPGDTLKYKYSLEYGYSEMEIHKFDIKKDWNVVIHDDLLATGGTAVAASELITQLNANISAFTFVIELGNLSGIKHLRKYSNNIISLMNY